MNFILPPLRKKIFIEIVRIAFLLTCFGIILLVVVHKSSFISKSIIEKNHVRTNQFITMVETWDILNSKSLLKTDIEKEKLKKEFSDLITFIKKNEMKNENLVTISEIETQWNEIKTNKLNKINDQFYLSIKKLLMRMIRDNQITMAENLNHQIYFSKLAALFGCLLFFVGFLVSIYFSHRLSSNIAWPLKRMIEVLQGRPKLHEKLKFPIPTSLEVKILISEIDDLWKRLSELNNRNLRYLKSKQREMEVIFSAMEDAAVFFDAVNKIQYYNDGFLDILGVQDEKLISEHKWDDLPLMGDSYLQLRKLLRINNFDEVLFTCVVNNEDRIYRVRKKIVSDENHDKLGIILLLHDITKRLPPETFKETLHTLKMKKNEN